MRRVVIESGRPPWSVKPTRHSTTSVCPIREGGPLSWSVNEIRPLRQPALAVGDIHNRIEDVEAVLERFRGRYRSVVFLGDYFDSYGDCAYDARRTARWLAESIQAPSRIHLIGNHDVSYLYPAHPQTRCPGWTPSKQRVIAQELDETARGKLLIAAKIGPWLLSHAGFTRALAASWTPDTVEVETGIAQVCLQKGARCALLNDDQHRGGRDPVPGVLWADFHKSFEPVEGLQQVVGHSPSVGSIRGRHIDAAGRPVISEIYDNGVRVGPGPDATLGFHSVNWCIDCDLKMVALIDGDDVEFVPVG